MQFATAFSPHLKPQNSITRIMFQVLLALIPGTAVMAGVFGSGVLINLTLAIVTAVAAEAFMLYLRRHPIRVYLLDLSVVVTAVLLALSLPAIAPWWITVTGTLFAVMICKHLYGGLGYNPFNPAMAGYVLLLVSFPKQMTAWIAPAELSLATLSVSDFFGLIFFEQLPRNLSYDALTMATPLDTVKTQLGLQRHLTDIFVQPVFGMIAGKGWEWVSAAYLAGGLWLIQRRVIAWQIPVGMLSAIIVFAAIYHFIDDIRFASPHFHLFSGATLLGAFFIATDPVTASTTPTGRLIYGAIIGSLVYIIRTWGGYPDAIAFAVLLGNLAAPTIDYFTRPRVFGQHR